MLLVSAGLFLRTLLQRAVGRSRLLDPQRPARRRSICCRPATTRRAAARSSATCWRACASCRASRRRRSRSAMPLGFGGSSDIGVDVDGYTPAPNEEIIVYYNRVGSDYLRTLGIAARRRPRLHRSRHGRRAPDVAIVNETLARRYFAGRDPIGGRIRVGTAARSRSSASRATASTAASPRRRGRSCTCRSQQWYRPDAVLARQDGGRSGAARAAAARDRARARSERAALRRADDRRASRGRRVRAADGREPARRVRRARAAARRRSASTA